MSGVCLIFLPQFLTNLAIYNLIYQVEGRLPQNNVQVSCFILEFRNMWKNRPDKLVQFVIAIE